MQATTHPTGSAPRLLTDPKPSAPAMGRSPEDSDDHHEVIVAPVGLANARNSEAAIVELRDGRLLLGYSEFVGPPGDFSEPRRGSLAK